MVDKWQALYNFWSSFGVPAYEENSVPDQDDVVFPYITYGAITSGFDNDHSGVASIWTNSTSWLSADTMAELISERLKNGGEVVAYTGGIIWITLESIQSMGDPEDDRIKRKLISVVYHFA